MTIEIEAVASQREYSTKWRALRVAMHLATQRMYCPESSQAVRSSKLWSKELDRQ